MRPNQEDPDAEHAMGAGMRQRGHHSVSVAKRGLGSTDMCQHDGYPQKTPREATFSTSIWAGRFLGGN